MAKKKESKKKESKKEEEVKDKKQKVKNEKTKKAEKETKKERDWKQDKFLILSIIGIILLFGSLIYTLSVSKEKIEEESKTVVYNGIVFTKIGNIWSADIRVGDKAKGSYRDFTFLFHHTPDEVESIETLRNSRGDIITPNLFLNIEKIYVTTNPNYPAEIVLGEVEIVKVISNIYKKEAKTALTEEFPGADYPVITCNDINATQRIIEFRLGNSTKIHQEKGCVIIEGKTPSDVVKASERLAFEMLKIIT